MSRKEETETYTPICLSKKRSCVYLNISLGYTNINQKVERECYHCGLGKFPLTRNPMDLPDTCGMYKQRKPKKKEVEEENHKDLCMPQYHLWDSTKVDTQGDTKGCTKGGIGPKTTLRNILKKL